MGTIENLVDDKIFGKFTVMDHYKPAATLNRLM